MSCLLILRLVFVFPEIPIFLSSILRVFFCYSGFLKIKYVEQLYISGFLACVNSFKQNNYTVEMSEAAVTVRVRKFMRNPLLKRRQMVCYGYCVLELDDRSDSSQACFCLKGRA